MNNALAILAHALRMLTHEPATTLRVILPALLIVVGTAVAAVVLLPDLLVMVQAQPETFVMPEGSSILMLFILGLAGLVGYALMAILWHRHVLLNGTGIDSGLRSGTAVILGYLWRVIILGLVQFLVAIPIGMGMAIIGGAGAALTGGIAAFVIVGFAAGLLFIWIALRISVILPAAALGTTMRIRQSWEITAPISNTLWGVAVLLAAINMIISYLAGILVPESMMIAVVVQTLIFIIEGLVFVSVLTTLYGHLVEGRSLG